MAETEEALKVEVSRVCKTYYFQVWNETLNQAEVEASSVLRKAENVYYPQAICASSFSSSKADTPLEVANPEKSTLKKIPPPSGNPPKVVEQPGVNEKEAEVTKGVAPDATKPSTVPKILLKIKRHQGWKLFWQLFHFLPKVILKAQTKDPQRLQSSSPRPRPKEKL